MEQLLYEVTYITLGCLFYHLMFLLIDLKMDDILIQHTFDQLGFREKTIANDPSATINLTHI